MDTIIDNHDPDHLEHIYGNHFLFQNADFSIMAESTAIPWVQLIPNRPLEDAEYIGRIYATLYALGEFLKAQGLGEHFNVAKIGNKLPYYHIHLVMRSRTDEAWPEAIWCMESLTQDMDSPKTLKKLVNDFFKNHQAW